MDKLKKGDHSNVEGGDLAVRFRKPITPSTRVCIVHRRRSLLLSSRASKMIATCHGGCC